MKDKTPWNHTFAGDVRYWTPEEIRASVGPGWSSLVETLIDDLFAFGWDGELRQIKEKFGALRFYIGAVEDAELFKKLHARIAIAEQESAETCETCGKPGHIRGIGWVKAICDYHYYKKYPFMKEEDEEKKRVEERNQANLVPKSPSWGV